MIARRGIASGGQWIGCGAAGLARRADIEPPDRDDWGAARGVLTEVDRPKCILEGECAAMVAHSPSQV